jgi:anthranilate synthase component 2
MNIVVIDNYDSFVYNLVRYLEEIEQTQITVMRNDKINLNAINSADAIVLSPGPGIPSEAGELMNIIQRFHQTKPILGVCLGHQAIGEYFGAELIQNEFPLHGKSTEIIQQNDSKLFEDISKKFEVGRYHSWSINLDSNGVLQAIAETAKGEVMAIQHKTLPIYGVQFHPESILTPKGRTMINNWVKSIMNEPSNLELR